MQLRGTLRDARDPIGRPFRMALTLPGEGGDKVAVALHDTDEGARTCCRPRSGRGASAARSYLSSSPSFSSFGGMNTRQ